MMLRTTSMRCFNYVSSSRGSCAKHSAFCFPDRKLLATWGSPRPHKQRGDTPLAVVVRASSADGEGRKQDEKRPGKKRKQEVKPTPLSWFSDGTLILGDAVMIMATECSSERILWNEDFPILLGTIVTSWFLAAAILGDYRGRMPTSENLVLQLLGGAPIIALVDGTITWALSAFISLAAFAILIDQVMIDPGPLLEEITTEDTSPQLEVSIATLLTMSCWRGIAYKIRCR